MPSIEWRAESKIWASSGSSSNHQETLVNQNLIIQRTCQRQPRSRQNLSGACTTKGLVLRVKPILAQRQSSELRVDENFAIISEALKASTASLLALPTFSSLKLQTSGIKNENSRANHWFFCHTNNEISKLNDYSRSFLEFYFDSSFAHHSTNSKTSVAFSKLTTFRFSTVLISKLTLYFPLKGRKLGMSSLSFTSCRNSLFLNLNDVVDSFFDWTRV